MRSKLLLLLPRGGASGPTYTLVCDVGTFSLTGQAVAFKAARTLVCANGSFTLTGQTAALTAQRKLVADYGSFSLTGEAAALTAARKLTADVGTFALTGQDAGLSAARVLTADFGSFNLSGQDADFTYTPVPAPEPKPQEPLGGGSPVGVGRRRKALLHEKSAPSRRTGRPDGVAGRVAESAQIAAEVQAKLAREFEHETVTSDGILPSQMAAEIGELLRKKMRSDEDEAMLLILIAAHL